ncbi:hypothetical protein [Kribbella sp. NPDC006257]|uniref:hypothetical protein n=1 Tax=Kribbella sp. NPDC006257 TaxID=3156738 RepID=UPI0033ABC38C
MAIKWLQLVGGSYWGPKGQAFLGAAEARAGIALSSLESELLTEFDGGIWLAQAGYERVSVGLEFRSDKRGRPLRKIADIGRLITPEYSLVWPELENATVDEVRERLRPVVLDALDLVGERRNLGKLPRTGEAKGLTAVPLKPLIEDPTPYVEAPGDSFVIIRDLPANTRPSDVPAVLQKYEEDLQALLSKEAFGNIVEAETSPTAIRWLVQLPRAND